ncbi:MAG: hypothetical protein J5523_01035 [Muribaculaceae bacterium]|nr:hypothetical protein [Muribaculaceae bacterium]
MKKLLSLLMLLVLAIPAWAGEKTITISRNDVNWESANTVYNVTKGGVELVMSGGMNNPNFLLMKQHTTITVKSFNFNIKRIVFHCLDNYTNSNLDPFYWGPTTLHIQYSQTHAESAGTLTYNYGGNSYDALWVSTKSSSPGNYPDGLPAGYELMFENEGKPVRFASIDIVIEQEVGDMYELVTKTSELNTTDNYMLVGRSTSQAPDGYAMSVKTTGNSATDNIKSTKVNLLDNGLRVKANDETQFLKLQTGTGNNNYRYYIKAGTNTIRSQSTYENSQDYNHGFCLTKVNNLPSADYVITKITINDPGENYASNWDYYADIRYKFSDPYSNGSTYALRHNNDYKQFRNLYNNNSRQRVYLYKPAKQYKVTTEVKPNATDGSISLRDGVLVDNGINWSQKMDTVQFLVTAADGKKITSVDIQALDNNQVVDHITPLSSSPTINGTLYTFVMPGHDVNIVATVEDVTYHNINMVVKPSSLCGNIFLTEGYVVQQDQVKSYDGQSVVFNVTPNPINAANENEGYYELSYVTVTDNVTGVETTLAPDANGNYTFTMPDNPVTITAYFYDNTKSPLWLLGTANGNDTWHTYGPRFNYNDETDEYYIDVYFTGTGNYGDQTGEACGRFSVTWKIDLNDNWGEINGKNLRGVPGEADYPVNENSQGVYLWYGSAYENNSFKIPAGVYRIYVGTTASETKGNLHNNELKIEKYNTTLTFNPAGGTDAANAVQVPQNQVVSLEGNLYNKIKAINPNEADANFMYKATAIVDGNATPQSENATTATSTIATLDVVNTGETVTQLDGYNYLGWIVASNTAYYKVISTPLKWIEEEGTEGNKYTVADELIIMHKIDREGQRLLWAKDQSSNATDPYNNPTNKNATFKTVNQTDYLDETYHVQAQGWGGWDQSNWVMLRFAENEDMSKYHIYQTIQEGTLVGTYVDDVNFCINVESMETGGDVGYVPNTFCTANFLDYNLNLNNTEGGAMSPSGKKFFFVNPKVQEVADVTLAVWDAANSRFVMPSGNGVNQAGIIGYFTVSCLYNNDGDVINNLVNGNMYSFRGVLNAAPGGSNASKDAPTGSDATKMVMPFDLNDQSVVTAISNVESTKTVSSVKYYNITGIESDKPFDGVNIVLTRYTDGSFSTTKVLR